MTSSISTALLIGATLCALPQVHAAEPRNAVLLEGERMIVRCLDYAASQKYPPLSVGVIDPSGALVAFKRQDGASAATSEAALLKARTALKVNAPTDVIAPAVGSDGPTRDAFLLMNLTMLAGGIPLADRDGRSAGALGVSGGTVEQDTLCARRAAGAVADR